MQLLEAEMKKLQASTKEATIKFDENLTKLFEKKLKCEITINQVIQSTHTCRACMSHRDSFITLVTKTVDIKVASFCFLSLIFPAQDEWFPPLTAVSSLRLVYEPYLVYVTSLKKSCLMLFFIYFTGRAQDDLSYLFSNRRRRDEKSRAGAQAQAWKGVGIQGQETLIQ